MPLYWGLDLTSSPKKPSALVALDGGKRAVFLDSLYTDKQISDAILSRGPAIVAIDAPLTLPSGWCCLEESCPCHLGKPRLRSCEAELARLGIPCFFTTKHSFIKGMVYCAMRLKEELASHGLEVIEVYPYATKLRLWGKAIPEKTRVEGRRFLQEKVLALLPALMPYSDCLSHDLYDAALAAYTAFLYSNRQTQALGDDSGLIHIPPPGSFRSH